MVVLGDYALTDKIGDRSQSKVLADASQLDECRTTGGVAMIA